MTMSNAVVVLLSGGLDSMTLAAHALAAGFRVIGCHVHYGQPAAVQEEESARAWAEAHECPFALIKFTYPGPALSALRAPLGEPGPRVVPGRNALLVSAALSVAASIHAPRVWFGATADDFADYPDCRPQWVEAMSRVGEVAYGVEVGAPFLAYTKADVVRRARQLAVDVATTWSCYRPTDAGKPCGGCNA